MLVFSGCYIGDVMLVCVGLCDVLVELCCVGLIGGFYVVCDVVLVVDVMGVSIFGVGFSVFVWFEDVVVV